MIRKRVVCVVVLVLTLAGCGRFGGLDAVSGGVTAEMTETQGVVVNGTPTLLVNHYAGVIDVREGEAGKITANLTKQSRLDDEAEARAQLDEIVMSFTQSGTDVTLDVVGPEGTNELTSQIGTTAELELLVPPGTTLNLNLGAGEITVEQPTGDVSVTSGACDVTVTLPANASFRLVVNGGVADVSSEFEGVPDGGVVTDIDVTIGDSPTQTLTFNIGAGDINLKKAQ
jgi:hypothetical protein